MQVHVRVQLQVCFRGPQSLAHCVELSLEQSVTFSGMGKEEVLNKISHCVSASAHGPSSFVVILVIKITRFTREDVETLRVRTYHIF